MIEPCRHCGASTAAGSRRFAGRFILLGDPVEYVCPVCLDDHPLRDEHGAVLSKERLAGMAYVLPPGGSPR